MLFAIRTIQERTGKDLGATFLSGTTISNSLTELYLLFKYLRPKELERQDIRCFDAWAAIFAKKTTDFEFNVTNNVVQKERFRYFINCLLYTSLHIATDGCDGEVVKFSSSEKWKEKEPAMELYNKVKAAGFATVTKAERKEKTEETPLLYDLTTLQKEANAKHGFTAEQTLEIAQKLYEKKLITLSLIHIPGGLHAGRNERPASASVPEQTNPCTA